MYKGVYIILAVLLAIPVFVLTMLNVYLVAQLCLLLAFMYVLCELIKSFK